MFEELPDLSSPVEAVKFPTDKIIGILPLFTDTEYGGKAVFASYLKAAIYSRQTWLLHTDALTENVAIKLYIEDTLKSEAIPILNANGLSEKDVIYFNVPPLPDTSLGRWNRLGKKLVLYWDPQLADYEKIVYWDADLFKLRPPTDVFSHFKDARNRNLSFLVTITKLRRDWRPEMIRKSARNVLYGGLPIQDIFERAGLGRVLQEVQGALTRPAAGLGVYPAKAFHRDRQAFLAWLAAHGPYIGDDEYALALGAAKFRVHLNSIRDTWHLTYINAYSYLRGDTDHTFVHGKPVPDHVKPYTQLLLDLV